MWRSARRSGPVRPPPNSVRESDSGFASVVILALVAVLVLVGGLAVSLGSLAVTRHRAAAAADLSALAGALHVVEGPAAACRVASRIAHAQGAFLEACDVTGGLVLIRVTVRPSGFLATWGVVRATARAGPAA